jgi:hypothetical protein
MPKNFEVFRGRRARRNQDRARRLPALGGRVSTFASHRSPSLDHPAAGTNATREAAKLGITLDDTYAAKAFGAALARVALSRERTILYWQTLSSAPLAPVLLGAPLEHELDRAVRRLAH